MSWDPGAARSSDMQELRERVARLETDTRALIKAVQELKVELLVAREEDKKR